MRRRSKATGVIFGVVPWRPFDAEPTEWLLVIDEGQPNAGGSVVLSTAEMERLTEVVED